MYIFYRILLCLIRFRYIFGSPSLSEEEDYLSTSQADVVLRRQMTEIPISVRILSLFNNYIPYIIHIIYHILDPF